LSHSLYMVRDYDHLFKLVLIGDSGVGKSCILLRFADDSFTESYITTIGVDFRFRTINVEGKNVKLQIWDTAGQERFRTITSAYYRGADAIVLVYDSTDRESFEHVDSWLQEVNKYSNDNTIKVLIGNKSDRTDDRKITTEEGKSKADSSGLLFIETSAKDATHIEDAFLMVSRQLVHVRERMEAAASALSSGGQGMQLSASSAIDSISSSCCSS
jgi:Ras-related protein Rab-1A